jgi:hypothetical protein
MSNLRKWQVRQVGLALRSLLAKIEGNQRARDFIGEDMLKEAHTAFDSLSVTPATQPPIVQIHDDRDENRNAVTTLLSAITWLADPEPWKEYSRVKSRHGPHTEEDQACLPILREALYGLIEKRRRLNNQLNFEIEKAK